MPQVVPEHGQEQLVPLQSAFMAAPGMRVLREVLHVPAPILVAIAIAKPRIVTVEKQSPNHVVHFVVLRLERPKGLPGSRSVPGELYIAQQETAARITCGDALGIA